MVKEPTAGLSLKAEFIGFKRVPETESSGIDTSTVTVAVLPEVDDVEVEINPDDFGN